jgi:hypothetical protein
VDEGPVRQAQHLPDHVDRRACLERTFFVPIGHQPRQSLAQMRPEPIVDQPVVLHRIDRGGHAHTSQIPLSHDSAAAQLRTLVGLPVELVEDFRPGRCRPPPGQRGRGYIKHGQAAADVVCSGIAEQATVTDPQR